MPTARWPPTPQEMASPHRPHNLLTRPSLALSFLLRPLCCVRLFEPLSESRRKKRERERTEAWPPCERLRAFSLPPHPRPRPPSHPTPHLLEISSHLPSPVCGEARARGRGRALQREETKPGESLWRGQGKEKPLKNSLSSGQEIRPSWGDPRSSTGLPRRSTHFDSAQRTPLPATHHLQITWRHLWCRP